MQIESMWKQINPQNLFAEDIRDLLLTTAREAFAASNQCHDICSQACSGKRLLDRIECLGEED